MTVKTNGGWRRASLRLCLCAAPLLLLCGAAAARQGTGQNGSGQSTQSGQPSTTQTGTSGTSSQTNQAGGAGRTNQTGDASRGQSQQTQGTTGTQTQGAPVGGTPTAPQTVPSVSLPGRSQLPGAARVTQGPTALSLEQAIQLAIQNDLTTLGARQP